MVTLPRTDPYLEDEENFVHLDALWLANLVDIINSAMGIIENNLASLDARITALGG